MQGPHQSTGVLYRNKYHSGLHAQQATAIGSHAVACDEAEVSLTLDADIDYRPYLTCTDSRVRTGPSTVPIRRPGPSPPNHRAKFKDSQRAVNRVRSYT